MTKSERRTAWSEVQEKIAEQKRLQAEAAERIRAHKRS